MITIENVKNSKFLFFKNDFFFLSNLTLTGVIFLSLSCSQIASSPFDLRLWRDLNGTKIIMEKILFEKRERNEHWSREHRNEAHFPTCKQRPRPDLTKWSRIFYISLQRHPWTNSSMPSTERSLAGQITTV